MQIHLINPNTTASMTDQMVKVASAISNTDTIITGRTPSHGPVSIESHFDEAMSIVGVSDEVLRADAEGADGMILACFGDPNIWAVRELTNKPVLGIAQAAFIMASMVSTKFAVVTSLQRTVIIAEHLLNQYGYGHLCQQVLAVDLPVLSLEDDSAKQAIINKCIEARDAKGHEASAIVLGCGGMTHLRQEIEDKVGIPIIDGVQSAVKLLEAMIGMGLQTSKHGDLAYPIPKPFMGDLNRFGN
ncbi:aspartate/glutamate racemase family protein [Psychrobacter sp.]|uniref:aspartate/glutamate racemase family protein n=1 Tax=Psychrobacter sp. TaxID=56811 RepID=UPI0025DC92B1|nr:aspartate/glutamate racemase family protein [Psychrobacter sp.]